ncbi:MAG: alkylhydroperoxidase [Gammaproteobacteria bacterium]|nr:MAG: alkylhydroperoxidase [Gammaproteobacteria bacterium]
MAKSYTDITKNTAANIAKLRNNIPETLQSFSNMSTMATQDGVLDKKTKEFIALAIAVTQRCDACIGFHIKALVRLGATEKEISETLGMCVYMGGGPAYMYAADALGAYHEFTKKN